MRLTRGGQRAPIPSAFHPPFSQWAAVPQEFAWSHRAGSGCLQGVLRLRLHLCSPSHGTGCCCLCPLCALSSTCLVGVFFWREAQLGKCTRLIHSHPQLVLLQVMPSQDIRFEHRSVFIGSRANASAKCCGVSHVAPHEKCKGWRLPDTSLGISCFVNSDSAPGLLGCSVHGARRCAGALCCCACALLDAAPPAFPCSPLDPNKTFICLMHGAQEESVRPCLISALPCQSGVALPYWIQRGFTPPSSGHQPVNRT